MFRLRDIEHLCGIIGAIKELQKLEKTLPENTLAKRLIEARISKNTLRWAEPVLQGIPEDIRALFVKKAEEADQTRIPLVQLIMMTAPYRIDEALGKFKHEKLERPLIEDVLGYVSNQAIQEFRSSEIFTVVFPHKAQNGKILGVIKSWFGVHVFWIDEHMHSSGVLIPPNIYVAGIKKGSALF